MPFPPIQKTMEGLLKDTAERLGLVERRLAIGGAGGAPYDSLPGMVMPFAGGTVPDGWLLCDGLAVSRSSYSKLFGAIGTTYGAGDGSTTFNLPNYKGRVLVGQDTAQTEFDVLGETGGEKAHQLTIAEMPRHSHGQAVGNDNNLGGNYGWQAVDDKGGDLATNLTGGDGAHNNLQPYAVAQYIISTGEGVGGGSVKASSGSSVALAGIISPFAGAVTPSGWLPCNGQAVSRVGFSSLFATIGTFWGAGDGSTTFNVPDLRGRVPVGLDSAQGEFDGLGEKGGEKSVTLTINEMPSHSHQWAAAGSNNVNSVPGNWDDIVGANSNPLGVGPANPEVGNGISPRGGGQAHNNLPPYAVANYIISTGSGLSGGGAVGQTVSARVHGSTQSFPHTQFTAVNFTTEDHDTANLWNPLDPSVLRAPVAGVYEVVFSGGFLGSISGRIGAIFTVNGVQTPGGSLLPVSAADPGTVAVTTLALNANDAVRVLFFQESGVAQSAGNANWNIPTFSLSLIGGLPPGGTLPQTADAIYGRATTSAAGTTPATVDTDFVVSNWNAFEGKSGMWSAADPGKFVLNKAGRWRVTGKIRMNGASAGIAYMKIAKNGAVLQATEDLRAISYAGGYPQVNDIVTSNGTDYVTFVATNSNASQGIVPVNQLATFEWIGA